MRVFSCRFAELICRPTFPHVARRMSDNRNTASF